jgi:carboxypeptidase C (cathepsin A)
MRQVGMTMTRKVVGPRPERLRLVEGSHLFPMEQPLLTAQLVAEVIEDLRA